MGFSTKDKENLMVASARHCCVCHRYRGLKVEVHHIKPKEQNGDDSYENGIPLCFDCHSDAGHYFAKHPKGTKFSPSELKKHKDNWFRIVKNNQIPIEQPNELHCRYIISKEFDVIRNICDKDLSSIFIENSILLENSIFKQLCLIIGKQQFRRLENERPLDYNHEEYLSKYPDAVILEKDDSDYSPFLHKRIANYHEILKHCNNDAIAKYLMDNGVNPDEFVITLTCYEGGCGGGYFQELYVLKPIYFKALAITNLSNHHLTLVELYSSLKNETLYSSLKDRTKVMTPLPNVMIAPSQSVIVPIGIFMTNFDGVVKNEEEIKIKEIPGDRSLTFEHCSIKEDHSIKYIGEHHFPNSILYNTNGKGYKQDIHNFDFSNLYCIDGFWNCGSCPHLFFAIDNIARYQGELFTTKPNISSCKIFSIPLNVEKVIIAELEHEITILEEVYINGILKSEMIILERNQEVSFAVNENDKMKIKGYYKVKSKVYKEMPPFEKCRLINKYIKDYA